MDDPRRLIDEYESGVSILRKTLDAISPEQHAKNCLDCHPIAGQWSIREVICHLADSEVVYVDRMKRVLAEDNPTFFEADPDEFQAALHPEARDLDAEVEMMAMLRSHMASVLRCVSAADFLRVGQHSLDGQMNLMTLLERITKHIPHHARFIDDKLRAMER